MSGSDRWSLQVTTSLGADALRLLSLEGEEYLSAPFRFSLALQANQAGADIASLIGKPAHVALIDGDGNTRDLHGIITRLSGSGGGWSAELRPWLWLLSLTVDCRIFQNQSAPDIIKQVFSDLGQTDYRDELALTYTALDYCVQYNETAFAFVSRLMEESGIAYYFEYSDSSHTLVLVDDVGKFKDCAHAASIPFLPLGEQRDWLSGNRIDSAAQDCTLVATGYMASDWNFVTPSTDITSALAAAKSGEGNRRVYEYPGRYTSKDDGDTLAKRRIEAIEVPQSQLSGTSPVRFLMAGGTFTMTGHPDDALNRKYALRSVRHSAGRREYANSFVAFPADTPFRPPRETPVPRIAGAQTAIVVGPSGKEIWTDKYGRIKVQFPWDRLGKNDENSSCWLRVAQSLAGKSWGAFSLPRIGQEVVVTFLDGDPDRPLITGCVYNGDFPVPYTLPEEQTKTTLKSNSSEGGQGFNEIRLEDKAGSEEMFFQAQKDMTITVLNDRVATVKHDDKLTVSEGDRTVTVSAGKETHTVKTTRDLTVTGVETHKNEADFSHTVKGNFTLTVDGNITIKAGGSLLIQSGTSMTVKASTAMAAQAGTALALTGGTTMEITGGAMGTVDGGGMLNLKGGLVKVN